MTLSELLKITRQHFWSQNFTEVEVNYLNLCLPLEPNLYSFQTKNYYLPTSPEFALKKHLAQYQSDCFAISHCFRDLESSGPHHTPEFLMLEWYEVNKTLDSLQESLKKYLSLFLKLKIINFKLPADLPDNEPDFNQFFLNEIEPSLPQDKAVFVSGYPSFLAPLAAKVETRHGTSLQNNISDRFELYINGIEIANGCEENRDSKSIKLAFLAEQKYRQQNHLPSHPISEDFITNCASLPPCSGVGLGLDRLLMIINNKKEI